MREYTIRFSVCEENQITKSVLPLNGMAACQMKITAISPSVAQDMIRSMYEHGNIKVIMGGVSW